MNARTNQFVWKGAAIIVLLAVLLIGAAGVTGSAARAAIPGDALYPLKTTIEQTRLSLAGDAGDRAEMKMAFADQRLAEISALIEEGRYREIRPAVLSFETGINSAILELETVAKADPARAARIAAEINNALARYAQTLSLMAAGVPDSVRPELTRALDTTHIASGLGQSSVDENSNEDVDEQGNDNSQNGNGDELGNGNENLNDNANANQNGNGDEISNDNGQNGNVDELGNGNENLNDNANANQNGNGDDQGNDNGQNGNTNQNGNGDDQGNGNGNQNENGNANQNSNDNGGSGNGNDTGGGTGGHGNDNGGSSGGNDSGGSGGGQGNDNGNSDGF